MSFIKFPVFFTEDDFEFKESLGLDVDKTEGEIVINTTAMCGYNENDNGNIMCRMANGDTWELPLKLKDFESLLYKSEALIHLTVLKDN